MATIRIKQGRVRPVWAGHPWVFAQAIDRVEGAPGPGDEVTVTDPEGRFLGRGYWSPKSAIPVRILTRDPDQHVNTAWLERQLERAAAWRREILQLPNSVTDGYRLVHGEGDNLGGLIVDVYRSTAVVQFVTLGMKQREQEVFAAVARITHCKNILELGAGPTQLREGFESETRVVRGPEPTELAFGERGFSFEIPAELSQKTGYYFDQRENRAWVEKLAHGRRVLDAFSYVGGFALAAARGGAREVVAIDSSAPAVAVGATIAKRNGLTNIEFMRGDLKKELPRLAREGQSFDFVIVDPPKLAPTARHLDSARRAYQRLNENALRLVRSGGLLLTCSCSAAVTEEELFRIVGIAARNANRSTTLLGVGGQSADHPVLIPFAEGRYLTALLVKVG